MGCSAGNADPVARSSQQTIYGVDDRVEMYEASSPELADLASDSTVALMPRRLVSERGGVVSINAPSWGEAGMLCEGRFTEQPSAAECTGTLVAPDLVLTAGHCLDALPCPDLVVVRGFYYEDAGELHALTRADVASCREVTAKHVDVPQSATQLDYAWFRIDPPLTTKRAVRLVTEAESVGGGSLVASANYGAGLPLKVQESARVADAREATLDYFVTNLDAFHGASGAPVFDTDHRVAGVLARGGTDLFLTDEGCFMPYVAMDIDQTAHEQATYAFRALAGLCDHPGSSPDLLCRTEPSPLSPGGGCSLTAAREHPSGPFQAAALLALAVARRIVRSLSVCGRWRRRRSRPKAVPSDRR